jgi:hypothetical protein
VTNAGDSYLFSYLINRARANDVADKFTLSRDNTPFNRKTSSGRMYVSYGHTFYRASTVRLCGRIHVDESNTFIISEAGFDGFIEIA